MIISIDTEAMVSLANLAEAVNTELSSAFSCLLPVTEHHDWNCKERDTVNEAVTSVRTSALKLKETAADFSAAVQAAANDFNEYERKTPAALQKLSGNISAALSAGASVWQQPAGLQVLTGYSTEELSSLIDSFSDTCTYSFSLYQIMTLNMPVRLINLKAD